MWMLKEQDKSQHWVQVRFESCSAAVPASFRARGSLGMPREGQRCFSPLQQLWDTGQELVTLSSHSW